MDRRALLVTGVAALTACSSPGAAGTVQVPRTAAAGVGPGWEWVRAQFDLAPDYVHMSGFLLSSHPRGVRDEIERYRRMIDRNPTLALHGQSDMPATIAAAVAEYLQGRPEEVALTDSTTMGLALIYHGLPLRAGQEVLTTTHDHYSHHESIRLAAAHAGATVRKVVLYDEPAAAAEIVDRLRRALGPQTCVVGVTWVHSSTGVKLPLRAIAAMLAEHNTNRSDTDRVLLVIDGVHGFGVEDEAVATIGGDFFAAGTHKWILGPRGTGIIWGRKGLWVDIQPTIPSFAKEPVAPVYGVALSPDGRILATTSIDDTARLWDVASHQQLATLTGHTSIVSIITSVAFSPDGRTLATTSNDRTTQLWNVANPARPGPVGLPLVGHTSTVEWVTFSPDGRTLATVSDDGTARLWDVASHQQLATLTGHTGPVNGVAFSPDGRTLATTSEDETVRLWDVAKHQQLATLAGHTGPVFGLAFSLDGRTLASASQDGTVRMWDPNTGRVAGRICRIIGAPRREEWARLIPELPYRATCS